MEPLVPSEVARLVFGYLKKEKLDEIAEMFLKSSPHLNECYEMYKTKGSFNTKVDGFDLYGLFDLFGTMCKIVNEQASEAHESKTMIERLLYVINANNFQIKEDKCVGTVLNLVDKCVGDIICTKDENTLTTISIESNKNATEVLDIPLFSDIISNNATKINEIDKSNKEISSTIEQSALIISSSPIKTQSLNDKCTQHFCKIVDTNISPKFKLNEQISSTPTKVIHEEKQIVQSTLQSSPNIIHNFNLSECQQIPEATSLESMPGFSNEDYPKDGSIIDSRELVDTFLNDKSLLEKIADSINKSFETRKETDNVQERQILDACTLEKAIHSTQSDPQIKKCLDEFLVFNDDCCDNNKNMSPDDQQTSIKTRLRSAKKTVSNKQKKNNLKFNAYDNDKDMNNDNNIVLVENKMSMIDNETCHLLSSKFATQPIDSNAAETYNLEIYEIGSEQESDYNGKNNFRKIAPKLPSSFITHSARILPKRNRRNFNEIGVRSQFRKTNIIIKPYETVEQPTQSIVIEVPNQSSFETKSNLPVECKISEEKCINKNETHHDTPGDRPKPPKNKSLSTPRRRSTHIRCLDFSTPQPKNNARDQARSKLFCDSPKKIDTIAEESVPSPLPKLQVNWGTVNGFEAIVKKDTRKLGNSDWDLIMRQMVGAGVFTSDADGRKTRKKKMPRKKIKPVNDKNSSNYASKDQNEFNHLTQSNEIQTAELNISEKPCDLNEQTFKDPLTDSKSPLKEIPNEFPVLLETQDKITDVCNEQPPTEFSSLKSFNDDKLSNSLEISDKTTELPSTLPIVESNPLKCVNDGILSPKASIFSISLETPKINLCNELPSNEFSISFDTPVKIPEVCNKTQITLCHNETQNKHEQPRNSTSEPENDLNQLNNSTVTNKLATSCSETLPEATNKSQEKDSNFLETFNHKYLKPLQLSTKQTENKVDKSTENIKKQSSDPIGTKTTSEIISPANIINVKHNLETPLKCDESAVDVPETPTSKLIREYDPSKLVTPLPSTPVHYEDSLTETPLTKIFRETSYLNRPPISPFPPTPGNSMSIDTLTIPPEQECSNFSNQLNGFLNDKIKEIVKQPIQVTINDELVEGGDKGKPTPLKTKKAVPAKIKSTVKKKSINKKNKQIQSVKVDLFGSEISSSSSADELKPSMVQPKKIVINKKPNITERKSGFKPIPRQKSVLSTSGAIHCNEKHLLVETNSQLNKSSIKPSLKQNKESSLKESNNTSNITQSKKLKKSMVHFDDPVEQCNVSPIKSPTVYNSSNTNVSKIENNTVINKKTVEFIGLTAYLERPLVECEKEPNQKTYKRTKSPEPPVQISKLTNSSAEVNIANLSTEKLSNITLCVSNNTSKNHDTMNEENKSSRNCLEDKNKKSYNQKLDDKILKMSSTDLACSTTIKTNMTTKAFKNKDSGKDENCLGNKDNDTRNLNQSDSVVINHTAITTSVVTAEQENDSIQLTKDSSALVDNAFEIIADDGTSKMLFLSISDKLTLLDLTSEVNYVQFSPLITSSSSNKLTTIPELETGELVYSSDDEIINHVTSTPKDTLEKKIDDRPKYTDDRFRDSLVRRKYNYRDSRHDRKYWSNRSWRQDEPTYFDSRNRSKNNHFKREYDDSIRDNYRFKYKDDRRRSYRDFNRDDDRRGRLEEPDRSSTGQRMSQKLNKLEDIKKTTKRPADRSDHNKTPAKVSKVEHQRLLKNVNVDDFLSVVHGRK